MFNDDMAQLTVQPATGRPATRASLAAAARVTGPRLRSSRRVGTLLVWFIVMLAFTAFFVVPVIWLLIAPTKTDHQLVFENPMAFGSFHTFVQTWDKMYDFQAHELLTWLENSALYSVGGGGGRPSGGGGGGGGRRPGGGAGGGGGQRREPRWESSERGIHNEGRPTAAL